MERFYELFPWPENPYDREGRARYEEVLGQMSRVVEHGWIRERIGGRSAVRVVDFCSGTGIGGVAMARSLRERYGVEVDLLLVDVRGSALEVARRFSREELGFEARTMVADVTQALDLGGVYDVALLWGLTTPHFSPWGYVRFLANAAGSLCDRGVYVCEEFDRAYSVLTRGYREVVPESLGGRLVLDMHVDYDPLTGCVTRAVYDVASGRWASSEQHLWGLASSMALAWVFFEDVDFVPLRSQYHGAVVAANPRRSLRLGDYFREPLALAKRPRQR